MTIRKRLNALQRHCPNFFWGSVLSLILMCAVSAGALFVNYLTAQNEVQKLAEKLEQIAKCDNDDIKKEKESVNNLLEKYPIEEKQLLSGDRVFFVSARTFIRAGELIGPFAVSVTQ